MQLLTAQNAYEIRTLLRLGFTNKHLVNTFLVYFVRLFLFLSVAAFLLFWLTSYYLQVVFESGGLYLNPSLSFYVGIILVITCLVFTLAALASARKEINRQLV
jgi:hypothetical protein